MQESLLVTRFKTDLHPGKASHNAIFFFKPFGVSLGDVWFFLLLIVDGILSHIQTKATEQYFPVVLFIMPYKVVLTCESVDEILKCDHSNES